MLFVSFPCRYNAIVKNLWYKHFLSLVVSTFQLMGTFLYCGTEALLGFKHVSLVGRLSVEGWGEGYISCIVVLKPYLALNVSLVG